MQTELLKMEHKHIPAILFYMLKMDLKATESDRNISQVFEQATISHVLTCSTTLITNI